MSIFQRSKGHPHFPSGVKSPGIFPLRLQLQNNLSDQMLSNAHGNLNSPFNRKLLVYSHNLILGEQLRPLTKKSQSSGCLAPGSGLDILAAAQRQGRSVEEAFGCNPETAAITAAGAGLFAGVGPRGEALGTETGLPYFPGFAIPLTKAPSHGWEDPAPGCVSDPDVGPGAGPGCGCTRPAWKPRPGGCRRRMAALSTRSCAGWRRVIAARPDRASDPVQALSVEHFSPCLAGAALAGALGPGKNRREVAANNRIPPLTIRVNTLKTGPAALRDGWAGRGEGRSLPVLPRGPEPHRDRGLPPLELASYREGLWLFQDWSGATGHLPPASG